MFLEMKFFCIDLPLLWKLIISGVSSHNYVKQAESLRQNLNLDP